MNDESLKEILKEHGWEEKPNKRYINRSNYLKTRSLLKFSLIFLMFTIFIVPFSLASFTAKNNSYSEVKVATWNFKVGEGLDELDINLADTIVENKYSMDKVVPGTKGVIQLSLDFTNTKVSTDYDIDIDNDNTIVPSNLKFYEDSNYSIEFNGYKGRIELDNINNSIVKRIYWKWDFTDDDESSWANKEIKLNFLCNAKQIASKDGE